MRKQCGPVSMSVNIQKYKYHLEYRYEGQPQFLCHLVSPGDESDCRVGEDADAENENEEDTNEEDEVENTLSPVLRSLSCKLSTKPVDLPFAAPILSILSIQLIIQLIQFLL